MTDRIVKFTFEDTCINFPFDLLKTDYWIGLGNFGINKNNKIIEYQCQNLELSDIMGALTIILQSDEKNNSFRLLSKNIIKYSTKNPDIQNNINLSTLNNYAVCIKLLDEWELFSLLKYFKMREYEEDYTEFFKNPEVNEVTIKNFGEGLRLAYKHINDSRKNYCNEFTHEIINKSIKVGRVLNYRNSSAMVMLDDRSALYSFQKLTKSEKKEIKEIINSLDNELVRVLSSYDVFEIINVIFDDENSVYEVD